MVLQSDRAEVRKAKVNGRLWPVDGIKPDLGE